MEPWGESAGLCDAAAGLRRRGSAEQAWRFEDRTWPKAINRPQGALIRARGRNEATGGVTAVGVELTSGTLARSCRARLVQHVPTPTSRPPCCSTHIAKPSLPQQLDNLETPSVQLERRICKTVLENKVNHTLLTARWAPKPWCQGGTSGQDLPVAQQLPARAKKASLRLSTSEPRFIGLGRGWGERE